MSEVADSETQFEGGRSFYARDRAGWRAWLERNHADAARVWLVLYKKHSGVPCVSYEEAVEEALCFGWIDGRTRSVDARHYVQSFSPRKPGSTWARSNRARVERLIEQGLMTPAGNRKIEMAKQDGSWDALEEIDNLAVPVDLQEALAANPAARSNFAAFADSSKKMILWWIASAKRAETRSRRIEETVSRAARGIALPDPGQRR